MLKKLGLIQTPEDAFANGFMIGCTIALISLIMSFLPLLSALLNRCNWVLP